MTDVSVPTPPPRDDRWLAIDADNRHSQNGEDGVFVRLLDVLPARDSWCCEFGAWDGRLYSNSLRLIEEHGYRAVLIEGDAARCEELRANHRGNPGVHALNRLVQWEGESALDALLAATPIPRDFDFLSIDVDGNEYHIWAALRQYRPKVVCVEFNATIPDFVDWVQPADPALMQGCSLDALVRLGREKGYELAAVLPWNAVFIDAPYFPALGIAHNAPSHLRRSRGLVTSVFWGYDGSFHLAGHGKVPYFGLPLKPRGFDRVPRFFRQFPPYMSPVRRRLLDYYAKWLRRLDRLA